MISWGDSFINFHGTEWVSSSICYIFLNKQTAEPNRMRWCRWGNPPFSTLSSILLLSSPFPCRPHREHIGHHAHFIKQPRSALASTRRRPRWSPSHLCSAMLCSSGSWWNPFGFNREKRTRKMNLWTVDVIIFEHRHYLLVIFPSSG